MVLSYHGFIKLSLERKLAKNKTTNMLDTTIYNRSKQCIRICHIKIFEHVCQWFKFLNTSLGATVDYNIPE